MLTDKLGEMVAVCKKEIVHCLREPDVIIYSVLVPFLLCPLMAIGFTEFSLWQMGTHDHTVYKLSIDKHESKDEALIKEALQSVKGIALIDCPNPMLSMKKGEIDGLISQPDQSHHLVVTTSSKIRLSTRFEQALGAAHQKMLEKDLADNHLSKEVLTVFQVRGENLSRARNLSHSKAGAAYNLLDLLLAFSMFSLSNASLYPSLLVLAEEREKKTIETTLLLPISRLKLFLGKFVSAVVLCLVALSLNVAGTVPGLIFCASQSEGALAWMLPAYTPWQMLLAGLALVALSTELVVFFCLSTILVSFGTKSFKQAQTVCVIPMLTGMIVALTAALPTAKLKLETAFIPLLNLNLSIKALFDGGADTGLVAAVLLESAVLIAIELSMIAKMLNHEEFLLSNSSWRLSDFFLRRAK